MRKKPPLERAAGKPCTLPLPRGSALRRLAQRRGAVSKQQDFHRIVLYHIKVGLA